MIDTVYPWTTEVSANVLQAFSRFFALVANAGRINRVPSLSVFVLGREIEVIIVGNIRYYVGINRGGIKQISVTIVHDFCLFVIY